MTGFDYVIVGAGSAGCVLAGRLTEDGSARVLLLEAGGPDRHPNIKIPAAFSKQFKTKLDWDYSTEPEPGCEGRSLYVPRGKALGGSSSMNAMLYVRGSARDYDGWEAAGCEGWGWSDALRYFRRAESKPHAGSAAAGNGGPVQVARLRSPDPLSRRFVTAAATAAGVAAEVDYNSGDPEGTSLALVTQRNGRRWSAADAYLRPARRRSTLTIVTHAHAIGIEMRGDRAHAVRYRDRRGRVTVAHADREVILCAGAIASPQLLMLSGIGPAAELRSTAIHPVVDLPGVGRNLQDHPYIATVHESTIGRSLLDAERPKAALEYLLRRSGPLSSPIAEAFAFVRSSNELPAADLQFHFAPAYFVNNGFEEHDGHAYTLGPVLISPRSRGAVRLRSADPHAKPSIVGNHLTEPEDLNALVRGVKLAREIAATGPLASATGAELYPGWRVKRDDEIEQDIRRRVELLYHPVGTCAMGVDEHAVVDPELRVRGVEALRVVDASVMPTITHGNTNAPTIMIAEKAADLIRGGARPGDVAPDRAGRAAG
jgi:choline dehydrogenase-like flavoprotein